MTSFTTFKKQNVSRLREHSHTICVKSKQSRKQTGKRKQKGEASMGCALSIDLKFDFKETPTKIPQLI